jgi:hypothetical protein
VEVYVRECQEEMFIVIVQLAHNFILSVMEVNIKNLNLNKQQDLGDNTYIKVKINDHFILFIQIY